MGNEQSAAPTMAEAPPPLRAHSATPRNFAHRRSHPHVASPHRQLRGKLSTGTPPCRAWPPDDDDSADEKPVHRPARRSLDVRLAYSSEPQRKNSPCPPVCEPSRPSTDDPADRLQAARQSLTPGDPLRRGHRNSVHSSQLSVLPPSGVSRPPPSRSPSHSASSQDLQRRQRRMSVDESQQRRLQARQTATFMHAVHGQKFSLAGLTNMNGAADERHDARNRINRAARDFAETGDFGLTLCEHLKLSSYQALMLTQSWPRLKPVVFNSVFRELSQKCPRVKELFQKTSIVGGFSANKCYDIKEHVKQLVELYDLSIQDLNAPCRISQDRCVNIGEQHFSICGPAAALIWDELGVSLTESISRAEAVRGKREAFKAYIALTSFLVDSMKAGYSQQSKRKSLTRASNGHLANVSPGPGKF